MPSKTLRRRRRRRTSPSHHTSNNLNSTNTKQQYQPPLLWPEDPLCELLRHRNRLPCVAAVPSDNAAAHDAPRCVYGFPRAGGRRTIHPFNAFLSGFCAAVGQFVLTASLRMQTSGDSGNKTAAGSISSGKGGKGASGSVSAPGVGVSHERAFADYLFGSLILHFFCINFIN
ncbi:hypothetical protein ARAM_002477 [Aspergillus rambellii]|uniref:Dolichyl-diphosphooligosaccharide--protein glycosyltransferase subunit OST2 n=1 Tax=Aspergillus rambellii TaxID=308745 RepID=A0A0F8UC87_9EURO|nr:hypothetical protein ARAM_002477 [Aspergillus rambellii]